MEWREIGRAGERLSRRMTLGRIGGAGAAALAGVVGGGQALAQPAETGATAERVPGDAGEAPGSAEPLVAPAAALAELPLAAGAPAGELRHLTDNDRGLWLNTGDGWRSVGGYRFDVRAFGAVGDGETDDWAAFDAAIEAMRSPLDPDTTSAAGRTLLVPPGRYRLAQSLVLTRAVELVGTVGSGPVGDAVLAPDPGITAIVVEGADPPVRGRPGRHGAGALIERLRIEAAGSGAEPAHGVVLRARATFRDCLIVGFGGDGIHIDGGGEGAGEADRWQIDACQAARCGEHGLRVRGASAGVCAGLLAVDNRKWGIVDESARGNTFLHCHAAGNGQGPFTTGDDNRSLFAGCAADAGQGRSVFAPTTIVVGGDHAAGYEGGNAWVAAESRVLLRAQSPEAGGDPGLPTVPTLRLAAAAGQTAPHLRVDDGAGERLVELDADGRLLVGPADLTPRPAGPDVVGLQPVQVQLSHPESGQAAIRWVVGAEPATWVAQARALLEAAPAEGGEPGPADARLTFQTPDAAGAEVDTLTLRLGRVGIGTTAPAPAAILELASASQGFLPPRLTTEQRDAVPAPPPGLTIFNLSSRRLNVHDGEAWQELATTPVGG